MKALSLLLPGDPETLTGGYIYVRRMAAGLRALGWHVAVSALDASFPTPTPDALEHARGVFAALPDGDLVVVDGLALGAMPALVEREAARLRLVGLVHHPLALETGLSEAQASALRTSERRALSFMEQVIVPSRATAREIVDYGVPDERIAVVSPGTDGASQGSGSGGTSTVLLCVATVTPRKGHLLLIDALAPLRELPWRLRCAGSLDRSPATVAALRQRIDDSGLTGRIELVGDLAPELLDRCYQQADLFVLPKLFEGYGMALAEALARGLPIVSTTAGAIPEVVPPRAGLLVPAGDVEALRKALSRVLTDSVLRGTLAAGARRAGQHLCDWETACARFAKALDTGSSGP